MITWVERAFAVLGVRCSDDLGWVVRNVDEHGMDMDMDMNLRSSSYDREREV